MGLQEISDRKIRHAAQATGLSLIRAMRHSNNLWFGWVQEGEGHWHVRIDPSDWDWEYEPGCGFSSCSEGAHGSGVVPTPEIVAEHERRVAERRSERKRKDAEASAFISAWTEETQKWLDAQSEGAAPK